MRSDGISGLSGRHDAVGASQHDSFLTSLLILAILCSLDSSVFDTSLYSLVRSQNNSSIYFGSVLCVYFLAQFISSFLMAFWADRRPIKEILFTSVLLMLIGNILFLRAADSNTSWLLIVGRILSGMGGGVVVVGYPHIARFSPRAFRSTRFAFYTGVTCFARLIGPLVGAVLNKASFVYFSTVNKYNASGSFMVSLYTLYIIFLIIVSLCKKKRSWDILERHWQNAEEEADNNPSLEDGSGYLLMHHFVSREGMGLFIMNTVISFTFWSFETTLIPIPPFEGDWLTSHYHLYIYIAALFVFVLIPYQYFKIANKQTRTLMIACLVMIIGALAFTKFTGGYGESNSLPNAQIVIATTLFMLGYSVCIMHLPALFIRLCGAQVFNLGKTMTWFFAVPSLCRLGAPLWSAALSHTNGVSVIAHVNAGLLVLCILIAFVCVFNKGKQYVQDARPYRSLVDEDYGKVDLETELFSRRRTTMEII